MRTLVINCSAPQYNLGASKLADWLQTQGQTVTRQEGDPGTGTKLGGKCQ